MDYHGFGAWFPGEEELGPLLTPHPGQDRPVGAGVGDAVCSCGAGGVVLVGEEDVPRLRFAGTPSSLGKDFPRRDMFLVDTGGLPSRRADVRQRDLGAGAWGNGKRPAVAADDIGAGGIGSDAGGIWSGIGKLEAARARQRDLAVAGAWRASAAGKGEREPSLGAAAGFGARAGARAAAGFGRRAGARAVAGFGARAGARSRFGLRRPAAEQEIQGERRPASVPGSSEGRGLGIRAISGSC